MFILHFYKIPGSIVYLEIFHMKAFPKTSYNTYITKYITVTACFFFLKMSILSSSIKWRGGTEMVFVLWTKHDNKLQFMDACI